MYVILVYDIKMDDEGSKIWSNTYKICKRYLIHIQNSVFEGDLTKVQITSLQMELKKYIRKDKDSVILFKSRDAKWLEREMWGIQEDLTSRFL